MRRVGVGWDLVGEGLSPGLAGVENWNWAAEGDHTTSSSRLDSGRERLALPLGVVNGCGLSWIDRVDGCE